MKQFALTASLIASLAFPALALADGPPAGKYSAKITSPAPLKGTWTLSFVKNGTYTISLGGKVVVRGHDLSVGSQMQMYKETGSKACKPSGYYNFKRTGKTLTFRKLSDACGPRAVVLSHKFKLV